MASCRTWCGVRGATSTMMRAWLPPASCRTTTRGARTAPCSTRREAFRSSSGTSEMADSARPMNSTGTYQRGPIRDGRRRQRDEPSADRRERLVLRQDDGLALVAHGDRAGDGVFAHGDAEERGEIVECDELGVAAHHGRDGARAVGRDEPERRGGSGLAGHRDRGTRRHRRQQRRPEKEPHHNHLNRAEVTAGAKSRAEPYCRTARARALTARGLRGADALRRRVALACSRVPGERHSRAARR